MVPSRSATVWQSRWNASEVGVRYTPPTSSTPGDGDAGG